MIALADGVIVGPPGDLAERGEVDLRARRAWWRRVRATVRTRA